MKNKVYYGEFALSHWIRLMLTGDIILPEYQRQFVWKKIDVERMMKGISQDHYVPPVTIARYKLDDKYVNLILDGQQRLTSLLLSVLQRMPIIDDYEEWKFSNLLSPVSSENKINNIRTRIDGGQLGNFETIVANYDDSFYKSHYLGYAYIVPNDDSQEVQQSYYSSVFMTINTSGTPLSKVQSRQAMYYFHKGVTPLFKPNLKTFISGFGGRREELDFPKYLAVLSQLEKVGNNFNKIAAGFNGNTENYILQYIHSVNHTPDLDDQTFGHFNELFTANDIELKMSALIEDWNTIKGEGEKELTSVIDADLWLFGLIHYVMFKNKRIDKEKVNLLKQKISYKIRKTKKDDAHSKSPNATKYLRDRLKSSISIYKSYVD